MKRIASLAALAISAPLLAVGGPGDSAHAAPNCTPDPWTPQTIVCYQTPEDIYGVMANWNTAEVLFTSAAIPEIASQRHQVSLPNQDGFLSMGMAAYPEPRSDLDGIEFGPYWEWVEPGHYSFSAIFSDRGDESQIGKNHTYMLLGAMPEDDWQNWEVWYDFNRVAAPLFYTEIQPRLIRAGQVASDPKNTHVPNTVTRNQYMTGNRSWYRHDADSTQLNTSASFCSDSSNPDGLCYNARLNNMDGKNISWSMGKPLGADSTSQKLIEEEPEERPTIEGSGVVNGVDQGKLAACLESNPENCLQEIEGLADCVMEHDVCNTTSQSSPPEVKEKRAFTANTSEVRALVGNTYKTDSSDLEIVESTVADFNKSSEWGVQTLDSQPEDRIWVVTSTGTATDPFGTQHHGLQAVVNDRGDNIISARLGG